MTLSDLKSRVAKLSSDDLTRFAQWLEGYLAGRRSESFPVAKPKKRTDIASRERFFEHIPDVSVTADIEEHGDLRFRYSLEIVHSRRHELPETACVVMQNPSYADSQKADATIKRLERVVFEKELPEFRKIGRLIVVNQFARIQTADFEGGPQDIGSRNDAVLLKAIRDAEIIVIAWGVTNSFQERQRQIWDIVSQMPEKKVFIAKKHPGRSSYDDFMYRHEAEH